MRVGVRTVFGTVGIDSDVKTLELAGHGSLGCQRALEQQALESLGRVPTKPPWEDTQPCPECERGMVFLSGDDLRKTWRCTWCGTEHLFVYARQCPWCEEPIDCSWVRHTFVVQDGIVKRPSEADSGLKHHQPTNLPDGVWGDCPHCGRNYRCTPDPHASLKHCW